MNNVENGTKDEIKKIIAGNGKREDLLKIVNENGLKRDLDKTAYFTGKLKGRVAGTASSTITDSSNPIMIIAYMPTDVGNVANYRGTQKPSINLGVRVEAKQFTYEEDAFDNQYDKNTVYKNNLITGGNLIVFDKVSVGEWEEGEIIDTPVF